MRRGGEKEPGKETWNWTGSNVRDRALSKIVETRAKANVSAGDPAYTFAVGTCSDALSADLSLQHSMNFLD